MNKKQIVVAPSLRIAEYWIRVMGIDTIDTSMITTVITPETINRARGINFGECKVIILKGKNYGYPENTLWDRGSYDKWFKLLYMVEESIRVHENSKKGNKMSNQRKAKIVFSRELYDSEQVNDILFKLEMKVYKIEYIPFTDCYELHFTSKYLEEIKGDCKTPTVTAEITSGGFKFNY